MQDTVIIADTAKRRSRRSYTKAFKAQVVAQCDRGDKSIAQIAMEHQINANLIHKWSRQLKALPHQPMVPVTVETPRLASPGAGGYIEVLMGAATIRFYGPVDPASAHVLLAALR